MSCSIYVSLAFCIFCSFPITCSIVNVEHNNRFTAPLPTKTRKVFFSVSANPVAFLVFVGNCAGNLLLCLAHLPKPTCSLNVRRWASSLELTGPCHDIVRKCPIDRLWSLLLVHHYAIETSVLCLRCVQAGPLFKRTSTSRAWANVPLWQSANIQLCRRCFAVASLCTPLSKTI